MSSFIAGRYFRSRNEAIPIVGVLAINVVLAIDLFRDLFSALSVAITEFTLPLYTVEVFLELQSVT